MDKSESSTLDESDSELKKLERSARNWRWGLLGFVCLVVAFYAVRFLLAGSGLSSNPAEWGQFGDYLGGLLNPVIAFCAFLWLARGVLLQRQEMREAYKALKESAEAQKAMLTMQQSQIERMDVQNKNLETAAIIQERANIIASIQTQISIFSQRIDVAMATYNAVLVHGHIKPISWLGLSYKSGGEPGIGQLKSLLDSEIRECRNSQDALHKELVWALSNRLYEANRKQNFGAQ